MYTRSCPTCTKLLTYKSKQCLVAAEKKNTRCYQCAFSTRPKMGALHKKANSRVATKKYKHKLQMYVWDYLSQHPCVDCGESNILFLEFDHRFDKKEWVSFLIRKHASINAIISEIAKCDVRCIGCHRTREWSKYGNSGKNLRNVEFISVLLSSSVCVDCGTSDVDRLEFDHVRGEKFKNVSALVRNGYSLDRVKEEITKCEIVCCNCHRVRTASRGNWGILNYIAELSNYSGHRN